MTEIMQKYSDFYINNEWNAWTEKSRNTGFKSTETAVGDGEQKLGVEYNKTPLGQNVSYDLEILGEKWEVKKLDSDNSFRLGVEVASSYRQIINSVTRILEKIISLEQSLIDSTIGNTIKESIRKIKTQSGRTSTLLIEGLRKNEVSSSNLDKADEIIETLKKLIVKENKQIFLYSSYDGTKKGYDVLTAFHKLTLEPISNEKKLSILGSSDFYNRLLLTNAIGDDFALFYKISLREKLNELVRGIFNDIKLVLVHKEKGYKPITDLEKIYCNRITSGNPRCKIL
jgi:hypothetical protein